MDPAKLLRLNNASEYCYCCHDLLKALVSRYCPVFQFHPQEKYFPCSIPWYASRSKLVLLQAGYENLARHRVLLPDGQVTLNAIQDLQDARPAGDLSLLVGSEHYAGCVNQLDEVPVYVQCKVVCGAGGVVEALEINYALLYAFNGPHPILGCTQLTALGCGSHIGDWEHLTVRCEPREGALLGVWFNTHRNRDGQWVPAAKVPMGEDGRLRVHVALHSHGTYPKAGMQWRVWGVVNDVVGGGGVMWKPKTCVVCPDATSYTCMPGPRPVPLCSTRGSCLQGSPRHVQHVDEVQVVQQGAEWMQFRGFYGGVRAPCMQKWWRQAEPPVSRTTFERVFLHTKPEPAVYPSRT